MSDSEQEGSAREREAQATDEESAHQALAGWYRDPWSPVAVRWWDGSRWTGYVSTLQPAPSSTERRPRGPGISGGGIAGIGAGLGVLATIVVEVVLIMDSRGRTWVPSPWLLLVLELPLWLGFAGAAYVASRRNGTGNLRADFGLSLVTGKEVALGLLGALVARSLSFLLVLLSWLAAVAHHSNEKTALFGHRPSTASGWAAVIALTVIGAPFFEELFFRGLIQGAFSRRIGPVPALFVTAVIFSFCHLPSEGLFAPGVLLPAALVLGYLKMRTGRLGPGMVAHAVFNAIGLLLLLLPIVS